MGILIEEDYKGVLTGKEPIISGLKKAFGNREVDRGKQLTYESMNRDSGMAQPGSSKIHANTYIIKQL